MDHFLTAVDGDRPFADQHLDAVFLIETFAYQRQFFRSVMGEIRRQVDAVVGDTRFFTEHGNVELSGRRLIEKLFDKAMWLMPLPIIAILALLILPRFLFYYRLP